MLLVGDLEYFSYVEPIFEEIVLDLVDPHFGSTMRTIMSIVRS